MNSLKEKIIQRLEDLPDIQLNRVLDFVDFLARDMADGEFLAQSNIQEDIAWLGSDLSGLGCYEAYDWQEGEVDEGLQVEVEFGMGVAIADP